MPQAGPHTFSCSGSDSFDDDDDDDDNDDDDDDDDWPREEFGAQRRQDGLCF